MEWVALGMGIAALVFALCAFTYPSVYPWFISRREARKIDEEYKQLTGKGSR